MDEKLALTFLAVLPGQAVVADALVAPVGLRDAPGVLFTRVEKTWKSADRRRHLDVHLESLAKVSERIRVVTQRQSASNGRDQSRDDADNLRKQQQQKRLSWHAEYALWRM